MLVRPCLILATASHALASYSDLGPGKCTVVGGHPLYTYHPNKGEQCEQLCDESAHCYGYSTSNYNNCLLWEQEDLDFSYKGSNYSDCTTTDYQNIGWCSHKREYTDGEWSPCTLQCPEGCFWMGRDRCVPRPLEASGCWHPPSSCVPVYSYRGGLYHGCTTADNGRTGWCSHYFNFGAYGKWSNCTPCESHTEAACTAADGGAVPRLVGSAIVGAAAGAALLWIAIRRQGNPSARSSNSWALRRMDGLE